MSKLDAKSEKKVYKNCSLKMYDNVLEYKNSAVKLDNICQVSVSRMDSIPTSPLAYLVLLIGIILCFAEDYMIFGIIALVVSAGYIIAIASQNNNLGYYLRISMNSGEVLYFSAAEKSFLEEIVADMIKCFNDRKLSYHFDLSNSQISQMMVGDNNTQVQS